MNLIPNPSRWLRGGWLWLLLGLLLAGPALAHPILQNPVWIEVAPDRIKVKLYVSMRELNVVQGLPIAADGAVDPGQAEESAPRHSPYVLDHLDFRADGVPLSGKVGSIEPPKHVGKGVEAPDRAHFIYRIEYPLATPPARITFSHTMVKEFPSAPGVPWDLSYAYRFGPPEATPTEFGAISRGTEVFYLTGFAPAPGAAPVGAAPASRHQPFLIGLALLGAALGLGMASRALLARLLVALTAAWLAGWGLGAGTGWQMPRFLAAALGGIGILLTAVDNIHRPLAGLPPRRWGLLLFFPAAGGLAAWSLAVPFSGAGLILRCLAALLGGGIIGSVMAMASASRPVPQGTSPRHPWLQVASLLVCAGGLAILFEGIGIRPWAYWLERFGL